MGILVIHHRATSRHRLSPEHKGRLFVETKSTGGNLYMDAQAPARIAPKTTKETSTKALPAGTGGSIRRGYVDVTARMMLAAGGWMNVRRRRGGGIRRKRSKRGEKMVQNPMSQPETRKINGKSYRLSTSWGAKARAKKEAARMRKTGYNVRVIRQFGGYGIYVRRKIPLKIETGPYRHLRR